MEGAIYIHDVASSVGLTPQAIRYYERLGLLDKAQRSPLGYRVYSSEVLERVRFIKEAQRLGLNLQEIREVLRLKYSGQSPCDCVRRLLKEKLADLKKQMAEMEQMRQQIEKCLRASWQLSRLPHEASEICPLIQSEVSFKRKTPHRKGGENR